MKTVTRTIACLAIMLFAGSLAHAQLGTSTGTTTLNVTVAAEAGLTVNTGSTTLASSGTNFSNYTTAVPTSLTYYVRTTQAGGTGSITAKVTNDLTWANGGP